ncbi:MAG: hypothetical protein KDC35_06710 [Acidobacteria bacterium]|nr:hypothetical protein [Acidobacteriota bacterium]
MNRAFLFSAVIFPHWSLAQSSDLASEHVLRMPDGPVVEIAQFTVPEVTVDFDSFPLGPVSGSSIQSLFPDSSVTNITAVTRSGTGIYDTQTGDGFGLAAIDMFGNLAILAPGDPFNDSDRIWIDLDTHGTQFGVGVGDWAGPFNLFVYDNGNLIGSVQVSTTAGNTVHYIRSSVPFNRIELTVLPDFPIADWVLTQISTERRLVVPVLSPGRVLLFIAMLGLVAMLWTRHKRHV